MPPSGGEGRDTRRAEKAPTGQKTLCVIACAPFPRIGGGEITGEYSETGNGPRRKEYPDWHQKDSQSNKKTGERLCCRVCRKDLERPTANMTEWIANKDFPVWGRKMKCLSGEPGRKASNVSAQTEKRRGSRKKIHRPHSEKAERGSKNVLEKKGGGTETRSGRKRTWPPERYRLSNREKRKYPAPGGLRPNRNLK